MIKKGIMKKKLELNRNFDFREGLENAADNEPGLFFTKEDLEFLENKDLSFISSIKESDGRMSTISFLSNNFE